MSLESKLNELHALQKQVNEMSFQALDRKKFSVSDDGSVALSNVQFTPVSQPLTEPVKLTPEQPEQVTDTAQLILAELFRLRADLAVSLKFAKHWVNGKAYSSDEELRSDLNEAAKRIKDAGPDVH